MTNSKKNNNQKSWKISDQTTLLRTRVAEIESATVQSPRTGIKEEFYRLIFSDWVNVVTLTADRQVVLVRQYRFGSERIEIEIPGGGIEKGESPVEAGCRELLEETGYAGRNARVIGVVCPNPAIQNNHCYTILVEDAERVGEQKMDEMEDIEVLTVSLDELAHLQDQHHICHGLVLNALTFLREHLASLSTSSS